MTNTPDLTRQFWERFYATNTHGENGPVNRYLISEVDQLPPGTALDLGCGEGADAIWLAQHGWTVLGTDVSAAALDRARAHAARLGLHDRTTFEQHDLSVTFPDGLFDLVSAQYLHNPLAVPGERDHILGRAAAAVAPGGHLLVVSHWGMPSWHPGMPDWVSEYPLNLTVPTPEENLAALQLAEDEWDTIRAEIVVTQLTGPHGEPGTREDHLLHFQRHRTASPTAAPSTAAS